MRIASFCFNTERSSIGGAQTPAVAFVKWCREFNIDCDLVTNNNNINSDIPYPVIFIDDPEFLNTYDAVYFSTIGKFGDSSFYYESLTVPFVVNIHAEFDIDLYGNPDRVDQIMKMATSVIVIGEGYWPWHNQLLWHPCAQPEYLIDGTEGFDDSYRDGLIYAARLSEWKNAHILAHMSEPFNYAHGRIHVYGKANDPEYQKNIDFHNPLWEYKEEIFNAYDYEYMKRRNSGYKYIWDVSGSERYKIQILRLNLVAIEGMKFGLIPIADPKSAHPKSFYIPIDELLNIHDYPGLREEMLDTLFSNQIYTYHSVKYQFEIILNELLGVG